MAAEGSAALRFRGTRTQDQKFLEENSAKEGVKTLPSGLQYRVIKEQTDKTKKSPKASTPCKCHYRGRLVDGTEFDSSYSRGKPATFAPNQVVKGWTEALQLMREGDKWELVLPATLGYGERGAGGKIPGGAALIFDLEIVSIDADGGGSWDNYLVFGALALVGCLIYFLYLSASVPAGPVVTLEEASAAEGNPHVFFDMAVDGVAAGRIEFELFSKVTPRTAENFRALTTGEKGDGKSGKPLHFKGSKFHRIIPGFMCQGGDITKGNGQGGESIYGNTFADEFEHGTIKHTEPFLLSMANRGKNTNGSQFFITTAATSWLDGKHVVFGRVIKGQDVVKMLEAVGSSRGTTSKEVTIADSGMVS